MFPRFSKKKKSMFPLKGSEWSIHRYYSSACPNHNHSEWSGWLWESNSISKCLKLVLQAIFRPMYMAHNSVMGTEQNPISAAYQNSTFASLSWKTPPTTNSLIEMLTEPSQFSLNLSTQEGRPQISAIGYFGGYCGIQWKEFLILKSITSTWSW